MEETFKNLGEWVRIYRAKKRLTLQQLATLAGVTKSYVSNIERYQPHSITGALPKPSIEVIDRLAKALDRPPAEAREIAGYGLKTDAAAPSAKPGNASTADTPASVSMEDLILLYFREIPQKERLFFLKLLADAYQKEIDRRDLEKIGLKPGEKLYDMPAVSKN